jgi:hypothetical protein
MKGFIYSHLSLAKAVLFVLFGVVAVFVDIARPVTHWTWPTFIVLALLLVFLEICQGRRESAPPLTKLRRYLLDFEGWEKTSSADYYFADPDFTVSEVEQEESLDYQQEWTRGEIGYHYETGNAAYYMGAFKSGVLLHKIHIVIFDGGKKIAVSPDWEAIGRGRIYFYRSDSIDYAYQRYLTQERGEDHSRGIRKSGSKETFDIPVFEDSKEVQRFVTYCNEPTSAPASDANEQVEVFFSLLEKYQNFKQGRSIK